jgi:hypothetical protein
MRDYSNIPLLDWTEDRAALKARAQILRQEPVILQMPDTFDACLDNDDYGCSLHEETGILYNCDGGRLLHSLAQRNQLSGLDQIAEACSESSSQVDIDPTRKRLIVHD